VHQLSLLQKDKDKGTPDTANGDGAVVPVEYENVPVHLEHHPPTLIRCSLEGSRKACLSAVDCLMTYYDEFGKCARVNVDPYLPANTEP